MKLIKKTVFFIIFELFFCSALSVMLVFYGPFTNIRDVFVTSAMTTMNHHYLAKLFLSQAEIDSIMKESKAGVLSEKEDEGNIKTVNNVVNNIEIVNIKSNRFRGYIMVIPDPGSVRVGTSGNLGKGGMTLSQIVKEYNADGGINAGGFGDSTGTGTGGTPTGIIIEDHRIKYMDNNASSFEIIGFSDKNVLVTGNYTLSQIEKMGIRDAVSFGPSLIINGKPMIKGGNGGGGIQPRTAIAQRKDGTVLLLVIDGRQVDSLGATLIDVQNVLLQYGAYNAANLDGGCSATMYYGGKLINKPSDILGERAVPSAFVIQQEGNING